MPRRSRSQALPLRPEVETAQEIPVAQEKNELVAVVLRALSVRDREVLARLYLREQPPQHICTEMGISEDQLRIIKSRAKAKFTELVRYPPPGRRGPGRAVANRTGPGDPGFSVDRAIPIMAHAIAVFGDEQKATHWFKTPLAIFDDRSPTDMMARGDMQTVETLLTRIEHNIPS